MLHMFHTYDASVLSGCFICLQSIFQVFSCVFACVHAHVSYVCCTCVHLDVSKVDRGCCAYCNVSHLPQLLRALCMEGSGAAGVEGHRSREARGSGTGGPRLCVQQALSRASGRLSASAAADWGRNYVEAKNFFFKKSKCCGLGA
jgi:hypothetical protein